MTTTKFSKVFGEVEIISQDATTTTVTILKTGEVKKLLNQYANLSNEPFVKVAKKKLISSNVKITQEDKVRLQILHEKEMRKVIADGNLRRSNPEAWLANSKYRQAGSSLR